MRNEPKEYAMDAAVVFDPSKNYSSVLPNDISYKIRMEGEWMTDDTFRKSIFVTGPSYSDSKYKHSLSLSLSLSLSQEQSMYIYMICVSCID